MAPGACLVKGTKAQRERTLWLTSDVCCGHSTGSDGDDFLQCTVGEGLQACVGLQGSGVGITTVLQRTGQGEATAPLGGKSGQCFCSKIPSRESRQRQVD